jgi:2-haloacid dehalogenase
VLSNGAREMLQAGLEATGLRRHFRWVLSADAVRLYKPSARVYALAPQRLKTGKRDILLVSSNSFDVIGAKTYGFQVCWINRTGAILDPLGPRPDLVVSGFEELASHLT